MGLQPRGSLLRTLVASIAASGVLLTPLNTAGQSDHSILRITPPESPRSDSKLDRLSLNDGAASRGGLRTGSPRPITERRIAIQQAIKPSSAARDPWSRNQPVLHAGLNLQSFGTGGGDILEIEPNNPVAQSVALAVNVTGEIGFNGDLDFFAFRALADQQITIEAFAARVRRSELFADIAIFNAEGELLDRSVGDADHDPLIRYSPARDDILIAGIADADDLGGPRSDYLLNITRGVDVQEIEPNGLTPQSLASVPVTIFGDITGAGDVDFYSFTGTAGQTLIVDVDAEVLGSALDPQINLLDPVSGVQYFYNDQRDGDDSRFNIMLPYTGSYIIGIDGFEQRSQGFYRLNISAVSGDDAPLITSLERLAKKSLQVRGTRFNSSAVVEVNGISRQTTILDSGTVRAKVKIRPGDIVTISNGPDTRRSNPLIF
jgi:hypothetical protein